MAIGWSHSGVNHTPAYQVSGVPWVTGSLSVDGVVKIEFPAVTRFFTVHNTGGSNVAVGFTSAGVDGSNFFTVDAGQVQSFDLRVRDIFISGTTATVDVLGGLTTIPRRSMLAFTGSNPAPSGSQYIPNIE